MHQIRLSKASQVVQDVEYHLANLQSLHVQAGILSEKRSYLRKSCENSVRLRERVSFKYKWQQRTLARNHHVTMSRYHDINMSVRACAFRTTQYPGSPLATCMKTPDEIQFGADERNTQETGAPRLPSFAQHS